MESMGVVDVVVRRYTYRANRHVLPKVASSHNF